MSPRDLVYVGHMLDMAKKAISKTQSLSRGAYDADENLRLALTHLIQIIEAGRQVSRKFSDDSNIAGIESLCSTVRIVRSVLVGPVRSAGSS